MLVLFSKVLVWQEKVFLKQSTKQDWLKLITFMNLLLSNLEGVKELDLREINIIF